MHATVAEYLRRYGVHRQRLGYDALSDGWLISELRLNVIGRPGPRSLHDDGECNGSDKQMVFEASNTMAE